MDRIGCGHWMEGVRFQFTSILWSMTWQEMKDLTAEENMIDMLINPFPMFSSPFNLFLTVFQVDINGVIDVPGISIWKGG